MGRVRSVSATRRPSRTGARVAGTGGQRGTRVPRRPARRAPAPAGEIRGAGGCEQVPARHGEFILDSHFPPVGHGTQAVEAGYMANAWVRLRHPDYDTARGMLDDIGRTIHVHAG